MPTLPNSYNPFESGNSFTDLGIDLFDSDAAIAKRIEEISAELDRLPEEQKGKRVTQFQDALKTLRNTRLRATAAVVHVDHVNEDLVGRRLAEFGPVDRGEFGLPDVDMDQVIIEGDDLNLAMPDFGEVEVDGDLMIELDEIFAALPEEAAERHFDFEL